jgi:hypothetical protein
VTPAMVTRSAAGPGASPPARADSRRPAVRDALVAAWVASVFASYPPQAAGFLRERRDRFRNPVGHVIREGLSQLVDELLADFDTARVREALDGIVRIRAVQDLAAEDAVGFVAGGKALLRAAAQEAGANEGGAADLDLLDARLDEVARMAQAIYAGCRAQVAAIRAGEAHRRAFVQARMAARAEARTRPQPQRGSHESR